MSCLLLWWNKPNITSAMRITFKYAVRRHCIHSQCRAPSPRSQEPFPLPHLKLFLHSTTNSHLPLPQPASVGGLFIWLLAAMLPNNGKTRGNCHPFLPSGPGWWRLFQGLWLCGAGSLVAFQALACLAPLPGFVAPTQRRQLVRPPGTLRG